MEGKAEKWMEQYITSRMKNKQVCKIKDCVIEYQLRFGLTTVSKAREARLVALATRTKERVKKRLIKYRKNVQMLSTHLSIPGELAVYFGKIRLVDLHNTADCKRLIKGFVTRDYCLAHGLQGKDIPTDPCLPLYKWPGSITKTWESNYVSFE